MAVADLQEGHAYGPKRRGADHAERMRHAASDGSRARRCRPRSCIRAWQADAVVFIVMVVVVYDKSP